MNDAPPQDIRHNQCFCVMDGRQPLLDNKTSKQAGEKNSRVPEKSRFFFMLYTFR
jgi:hypothetical protein